MTQYVGVVMIILVRKTLRPHISRVESSERGIGLLGFGGNKAVRFSPLGCIVRLKAQGAKRKWMVGCSSEVESS